MLVRPIVGTVLGRGVSSPISSRVVAPVLHSIVGAYGSVLALRDFSSTGCRASDTSTVDVKQKDIQEQARQYGSKLEALAREYNDYYSRDDEKAAALHWYHSYHADPHPEYLVPGVFDIMMKSDAIVTTSSIGLATFIAGVLRTAGTPIFEYQVGVEVLGAMTQYHNIAHRDAKMELMHRAAYLADLPEYDEWLARVVELRREHSEAQYASDRNEVMRSARERVLSNLFPPVEHRLRTPVTTWHIPALNMAEFLSHIMYHGDYARYACSAHYASKLAQLRVKMPTAFDEEFMYLAADTAMDVTIGVVDALWADYFVSGDAGALSRVLDLACHALRFPHIDHAESLRTVAPTSRYVSREFKPPVAALEAASIHAARSLYHYHSEYFHVKDSLEGLYNVIRSAAADAGYEEMDPTQCLLVDARGALLDEDEVGDFEHDQSKVQALRLRLLRSVVEVDDF